MTILSFFYFLYAVVMQIVGSCHFLAVRSNSKLARYVESSNRRRWWQKKC